METNMIMNAVPVTATTNGEMVETSASTLDNVLGSSPSYVAQQYHKKTRPIVRDHKKVYRNDPCPCGSIDENGIPKKYKKCCMNSGKYEKYHYV